MGPVQFRFGIGPTDDRFLHVWMSKPSIVRSTLLSAPVMLRCIAFRVATNPHRPEVRRRS
jgi:hypothetical protein